MSLGEKIREMRENAGLTQISLAQKVGISQPALARMEKGIISPSVQVGAEIARALGCDLNELVGFRDDSVNTGD